LGGNRFTVVTSFKVFWTYLSGLNSGERNRLILGSAKRR
jgi:hypothetical protein